MEEGAAVDVPVSTGPEQVPAALQPAPTPVSVPVHNSRLPLRRRQHQAPRTRSRFPPPYKQQHHKQHRSA